MPGLIICCSLKCKKKVLISVLNDQFYYHSNSRVVRDSRKSEQLRQDAAFIINSVLIPFF